ncbi:ABC transporter permease [Paenibacillus brevis]|uniref:ABC transporter permease n=1 Tax=Paenibacillus brevis TaxID=2841508 RepID=A0ABS6FN95_9BACL|nr:ABC transporter permease [Paenibacillus brevis]MBU5670605.1 ABC transporter permease [Paenibacillus brevis]
MGGLLRVLSAERLKMSKSWIWLILLASPVLSLPIGVLTQIPEGGDPWTYILGSMVVLHALLFLPILSGLLPAFLCRYEHTGGGWKQLLVLPVSRTAVYLGKLVTSALLLAFCQIMFLGAVLLAGWIQHVTVPVSWGLLATNLLGGWVACLPLAALQLGVSLSWASFAAPLAVNVSLTIPNMLIINSAKIGPFYPWAQPVLAMMPYQQRDFGAFNLPIESLMITVVGSFVIFFAAGLIYFRRKEI